MDGAASPASSQGRPASSAEFNPERIQEMHETKQELILKVQGLKKDLQARLPKRGTGRALPDDWRTRMDGQVKQYRAELGDLQATLTAEMGSLRSGLQDMNARIRKQLDSNSELVRSMQARGDPPTRQIAAAVLAPPPPPPRALPHCPA
eukprot:scaffold16.g117.t1